MSECSVLAPAKLNLFLAAASPGSDGFHPLLTVFQAVGLWERVTLRQVDRPGVTVQVVGQDASLVPLDGANLAVRAVWILAGRLGLMPAVEMLIEKSVPVAAGLAGGSADAAAALVAANQLWQGGLNNAQLNSLATHIGSDVNFCLSGGLAVGRGRGQLLEPIEPVLGPLHWVLLTRPGLGLSTKKVFVELDRIRPEPVLDLPPLPVGLLEALRFGPVAKVGPYLANDLAAVVLQARPEVGRCLELAGQFGALGAVVTGSGPTLAVLASGPDQAHQLAGMFEAADPAVKALVVAGPVSGPLAGAQ